MFFGTIKLDVCLEIRRKVLRWLILDLSLLPNELQYCETS
uniref:Uncharacterized protein n=1 Tax=Anguilla anguilla TaxID=7936 RepID=A0A0E9VTN8_ANGAN